MKNNNSSGTAGSAHPLWALSLLVLILGSCSRPVAQFTHRGTAKAWTRIQFENESEKADSYQWDFGDGNFSTDYAPSHLYKRSGIYDVRLTATREGKSKVKKQQLVVGPPDKCLVQIETPFGGMVVELFDSTPKHQDNFTKLVEQGFYDSLLFHRVIEGFMIQGGDPESRNAPMAKALGGGGPGYTIEAEFVDSLIHVKGALAAARTGDQVNPQKRSSGSQFYIVQGQPMTDRELDMMESRKNMRYSTAQREQYKSMGGAPFLDRDYTVFGRVIDGMDVIDEIAIQARDSRDRPKTDIWMKMTLIK
jgi:peptidyl-prolyl cis-trans isomerase B (cyclophilin B)